MKRFWLVLLSLGLIMAFGASAYAVDVKVSGSYYAAGVYLKQVNLQENAATNNDQSTAFYFQRLRIQTDLIVAPGLTMITRFDALERVFGGNRTAPDAPTNTTQPGSAGTWAENENIAFDYAYVKYDSPIGTFQVGAQPGHAYGTVFANSEEPTYRVKYISPDYSGFVWTAIIEKTVDNSYTSRNTSSTTTDADSDTYYLTGDYKAKNWAVGLLYGYTVDNQLRASAVSANNQGRYHTLNPYATAAFGPVKLQAEVKWVYGEYEAELAGKDDSNVNSLGAYLDAVATFGPVYVGGTFAYAEGDLDSNDGTDRAKVNGGRDWSPTLIMWNEDRARWVGSLGSTAVPASKSGLSGSGFDETFQNAWLGQVRVGVKPVEKLDVCFAVSYAKRDRVLDSYDKDLGWEFDVTGTYKITNNLAYMLGAGYLKTGDYFKGANQESGVENNYMIINKLTLNF
jgi:hypothetical protein